MNTANNDAQKLINYSLNLLSIQYNSEGKVMNRRECLPKAKMIARSHLSFIIKNDLVDENKIKKYREIELEIDNCF